MFAYYITETVISGLIVKLNSLILIPEAGAFRFSSI